MQICQICRCKETNASLIAWQFSLKKLQFGTSQGCRWCHFFTGCSKFHEDKWAHLGIENTDRVYFAVKRRIFSNSQEAEFSLNWPASNNKHDPPTDLGILKTVNSGINSTHLEFEAQDNIHFVPPWLPLKRRPQVCGISDSSSATQCFDLIKSWIEKCDTAHSECNGALGTSTRPKRLLQISHFMGGTKVFLVSESELPTAPKYTALSHCWGNVPGFKTTHQNLEIHTSKGIMVSQLPLTYQHAIDITEKLGCQYIWIDSICIVQGDADEWELACATMGHIYGNSYIVIGASHAQNGSIGCYTKRQTQIIDLHESSEKQIEVVMREKVRHDI